VDFSFRLGNAGKHGDGFLFHPRGKFAARDEVSDFGKIPLFLMRVVVMVFVFVMMLLAVVGVMLMREVDIKLHAGDGGFLSPRDVQVIAAELELFQFALQFGGVHAEVEQGGDEHVAGDAAENIEVKGFHCGKETSNNQHPTTNIERLRRAERPSSMTAAGNARSAATVTDKLSEPPDCPAGRRFAALWLGRNS
jgi:hypothetical protein